MRVSPRSSGVEPISGEPPWRSARYSQIAVISAMWLPSSSSRQGLWPDGFLERYSSSRLTPLRMSTFSSGSSMPASAMNMRTTCGFGPMDV